MLLLTLLPICAYSYSMLHLSDFHVDVDYSTIGTKNSNNSCQLTNFNVTLGGYGDYMCDSPTTLVDFAVDEAYRIIPSPDVLLWTGDNVPHIDSYDWTYVTNAFNLTTKAVLRKFGNVKFFLPTFGNHDYAPANQFEAGSFIYKNTWELWKDYIGDENKNTFLNGGYYKKSIRNTTFLVLNTNLYYGSNKAYDNFTDKNDPAGQFSFMESELKSAQACNSTTCNRRVNVVAHIPPGAFERTPNITWFREQYNSKFLEITIRYSSVIGFMLFGHHHTDTFHIVKDAAGNPVQVTLMSPSVTPWFSDLDGAGSNNPTFRTYSVDDQNRLADITTYWINLDQLNADPKTQFTKEYSFKDAYNISYIDAKSMSDLVEKMKTNKDLFMKYIQYNSVNWKPNEPQGKYRLGQLCSLEFADYPNYYACLNSGNTVFNLITLSLVWLFTW